MYEQKVTDNPSFFHFSRVHQHTRTVLQHILHVLSHWAGYVAGVLLAALLQGKEADRVERPVVPFPAGSCLAVSKRIPTSTLFGLASANNSKCGRGAQILVFTAVRERVPRLSSEKMIHLLI